MTCEQTDHEELAAYTAGDLEEERRAELARHVPGCARCQRTLAALARVDRSLSGLMAAPTPPPVLYATRQALRRSLVQGGEPEIMTLEEVGAYLRLDADQMAGILLELPAFELGGELRVRRSRLEAWIETRERERARSAAAAWVARTLGTEVA